MKQDDLEQLAQLPEVEGISIDAPVTVSQSAYDGCSTVAAGSTACGDPASQYSVVRGAMAYRSSNWDGGGIGVAVIDSGVEASDELNITASYDFRSGTAVSAAPTDGYGHGTHVAHLIASTGARSSGYYQGVAPGANLVGRDPQATVWLDSPGVSRHHARITVDGDHVTVEDLGSKNGTHVRGATIVGPTPLADGDEIRFGSMSLTFRVWTTFGSTASEA